ncbi:MAG: isoprenylcysteine carboxylmethyltransferase family protein, partial [Pseudonocardiaceae bacterium]
MTGSTASWLAFTLYVAGLLAAFGARTIAHLIKTGSSGFKGVSGRPGSLSWWGGVLFVVALLLGLLAVVLAVMGADRGPDAFAHSIAVGAGTALTVGGLVVTLAAQSAMGTSWRIGVDDAERTALVETGLFRWVRNPVFTGMTMVSAGVALLVPTVAAALSLLTLVIAIQLQVRVTEEPYLRRVHGTAYADYRQRTGRFIPRSADNVRGVGLSPPQPGGPTPTHPGAHSLSP